MVVFSSRFSTLWGEVVSEPSAGVVAVGFNHPVLLVILNAPLNHAHQFWLQLCLQELVGSAGFGVLEDVIFTQFEGTSSLKTSASINVVRGSIASLSSCTHSTNWCGSPGIGSQAFSAQCCNALVYARVFCGCFIQ